MTCLNENRTTPRKDSLFTLRLPAALAQRLNADAQALGVCRSQRLRDLIEHSAPSLGGR